jgi:hypothetical protein
LTTFATIINAPYFNFLFIWKLKKVYKTLQLQDMQQTKSEENLCIAKNSFIICSTDCYRLTYASEVD